MRRLILLALGGAAAWWFLTRDSREEAVPPPAPAPGGAPPERVQPDTPAGERVQPDTSADDPLVRREERAAEAEAASVGGRIGLHALGRRSAGGRGGRWHGLLARVAVQEPPGGGSTEGYKDELSHRPKPSLTTCSKP